MKTSFKCKGKKGVNAVKSPIKREVSKSVKKTPTKA